MSCQIFQSSLISFSFIFFFSFEALNFAFPPGSQVYRAISTVPVISMSFSESLPSEFSVVGWFFFLLASLWIRVYLFMAFPISYWICFVHFQSCPLGIYFLCSRKIFMLLRWYFPTSLWVIRSRIIPDWPYDRILRKIYGPCYHALSFRGFRVGCCTHTRLPTLNWSLHLSSPLTSFMTLCSSTLFLAAIDLISSIQATLTS